MAATAVLAKDPNGSQKENPYEKRTEHREPPNLFEDPPTGNGGIVKHRPSLLCQCDDRDQNPDRQKDLQKIEKNEGKIESERSHPKQREEKGRYRHSPKKIGDSESHLFYILISPYRVLMLSVRLPSRHRDPRTT